MAKKELEQQRLLEQQKIVSELPELIENVNRLQIEGNSATTVDEAIQVLRGSMDDASAAVQVWHSFITMFYLTYFSSSLSVL